MANIAGNVTLIDVTELALRYGLGSSANAIILISGSVDTLHMANVEIEVTGSYSPGPW